MRRTFCRSLPIHRVPVGLVSSLLLSLVASGCAHNGAHSVQLDPPLRGWARPAGWKSETIPFPLDFAPQLHHVGREELRFAPGFFNPAAPGYFSYAFVWWLSDREPLSAATLAAELKQYYAGLCTAVGKRRFTLDPARYRVELTDAPASLPGWTELSGQADLYDAFTTGQPLSLRLRAYQRDCAADARRAVLVLASGQPESAAIWAELDALAAAFHCP